MGTVEDTDAHGDGTGFLAIELAGYEMITVPRDQITEVLS